MLSSSMSVSRDYSNNNISRTSSRPYLEQLPKEWELERKDRAVFGLCGYEEIDNYFNELCQESNSKTAAIKKIANYTKGYSSYEDDRSPLSPGSPEANHIRGVFKIPLLSKDV